MNVYEDYILKSVYVNKEECRIHAYLRNIKTNEILRMSYPKYLMELHLNRYLTDNETVDHIDRNPLNNDISNLQILKRSEHAKLDVKRLNSYTFICPFCEKEFTLDKKKLKDVVYRIKNSPNYKGPYCSRNCANRATNKNFKRNLEENIYKNIEREYYNLKEEQYDIKPKPYITKNYHLEYLNTENKKYFLKLCKDYFGEDDVLVNNFENKFSANVIIKSIKLAIIWDNYIFFPESERFNIINDYGFHLKNIIDSGFNFYVPIEKKEFSFVYCNSKLREIVRKYKLSKEKFDKVVKIYCSKNCNKVDSMDELLNTEEKLKCWVDKIKEITKDNKVYSFKSIDEAYRYYKNIKFYFSDKTQERIKKILESDIDFSKFGWAKKVSELTGILHQKVAIFMKRYMPDFYEEKCFKRKSYK